MQENERLPTRALILSLAMRAPSPKVGRHKAGVIFRDDAPPGQPADALVIGERLRARLS